MDIINKLYRQLSKIKEKINNDIEQKEQIYNYLICDNLCTFLDVDALRTYLTETKINKFASINKLNIQCIDIINLSINEHQKLPNKKVEKIDQELINELEQYGFSKDMEDFYAFYLDKNCKFYECNNIHAKMEFFDKEDFNPYTIKKIVKRCYLISDCITGFHPGIIKSKNSNDESQQNEKQKKQIWFQVGLLFANGKAQELYDKYKNEKGPFIKITRELGFKDSDRPYISGTFSVNKESPKNIYYSLEKMKKIFTHCEENDIPMVESFRKQLRFLQIK